jgi:RNA polymerase sigma factor (sigma-70 family)
MDDEGPHRGNGMSAAAITAQPASLAGGTHDSELVRRLRLGDDRAFEELYQRYHRRITAYIQGMVHDHARAEDIAQDVFVSALRRMRDTDRPIAFKPWIYEIAKNACIDQFRRSRRGEEVSYDADEGFGTSDYGRLVSAEATPEKRLENKQSLDHLRGAFGGLSEAHHQILVMRELEGLSYREIGERLGMSRPSVESTLFRARRRLTEEYEELVSGARCQRIQGIIVGAAAEGLGARDQRRLARHVSHCQPCRRQARLAGVDVPVTADRPIRERIAVLLPLPLFLRRRWLGGAGSGDSGSLVSSHMSTFAQWSAQLGSTVDPSWMKAAATAATVAVAGVGAGAVIQTSHPTAAAGDLAQLITGLQRPAHAAGAAGQRAAAPAAPARRSATRTPTTVTTVASRTTTTATTKTTSSAARPSAPGEVADSVPKAAVPILTPPPHRPGGGSSGQGSNPSPRGSSLPGVTVPSVGVAVPDAAAALDQTGHAVTGTITTVLGGGSAGGG